MSHDVWIVMEKSALDSLWTQANPPNPETPIPAAALLLARGAVRGFWKDILDSGSTYEVVNVVRSSISEIDAFVSMHFADIFAVYGWTQGNGLDDWQSTDGSNTVGYPTVPQGVLDVMQNHPGAGPATLNNPNWGHIFLGQSERIFAGQFELNYSEAFQ